MTPTIKTLYEHDCESCIYLGPHRDYGDNRPCDLYYCTQSRYRRPTVIARYSNLGSDYTSGMILADHQLVPALVEAKRRVMLLGLPTGVATRAAAVDTVDTVDTVDGEATQQ